MVQEERNRRMKYLQTIIVEGKNEKTRKEKIQQIISELEIHPVDIKTIASETSLGIKDVREFIPELYISPVSSKYKVVILQSFEKATTEAQNALLKTFEEPPQKVILIAETETTSFILPTILSRAQLIKVQSEEIEESKYSLDVLNGSIAQKITFAGEEIKSKESALQYIDETVKTLHDELVKKEGKNVKPIRETIMKFQKARGFIERNINTRLTIEILLFSVKYQNNSA